MVPFRQAWRALARRPAFTAATILTLAGGIGITTALFSIVDGVLLRPLPFPAGNQLVSVYEASPARRDRTSLIAPVRLEDWNRLTHVFDGFSGSYSENVTDTSGAEPERLEGRRVTPRFFDVYGMTPLVGRTFTDDEQRYGGATAVIISEGFWTRRFARSPSAVGARLIVGGRGYTIVGVIPRAFTSAATDVWIPAQLAPGLMTVRDARFLGGVARMKPGVTLEEARTDLTRVQALLGAQYPKTDKDWTVDVRDLKDVRVGDSRRAILLIFGSVALLFVIAIANLAGLMLVQLQRRIVEFAIRSAIGASRARVLTVVMRETLVIAVVGALGGAALAAWLIGLAPAVFPMLPRLSEVRVDTRALAFIVCASVAAAAFFGLLPAVVVMRRNTAPLLSAGSRGVAGASHRLQRVLVTAQIALSVMLAASAGLLVRSYGALSRVDAGFTPAGALTFHVGAAWDEDRARVAQIQERLVEGLSSLPGVRAAGFANFLPATGATLRYQAKVDGLTGSDANGSFTAGQRTVTAGYLPALGVPLLAGEWCAPLRSGAIMPKTVMVNRQFVDAFAGGASIVGRNLTMTPTSATWRITGIVGNVIEDGPAAPAAPYVYMCLPSGAWPDPEYVVRADADPRQMMTAIRQLVREIDPTRPVFGFKTVEEVVAGSLQQPALNARLLACFAGAALLLAALGLHGMLTLFVTERRRELGVRMALGAGPGDLVRLVISGAGALVVAGMAVGVVLVLVAGSVLRAVLFGVTPHDVPAIAGSVLALGLVSLVAVLLPARQAASVSAVEAMRGE
jgi:putative ABC transport system permease protein